MCEAALRRANRKLIEAIETPPDTGREERFDRIAAQLWTAAEELGGADPGRLQRLKQKVRDLERRTFRRRAAHLRRARRYLDAYQRWRVR